MGLRELHAANGRPTKPKRPPRALTLEAKIARLEGALIEARALAAQLSSVAKEIYAQVASAEAEIHTYRQGVLPLGDPKKRSR